MPGKGADDNLSRELRQLGFPITAAVRLWWLALSDYHRARVRGACNPRRFQKEPIDSSPGELLIWEYEELAIEADEELFRFEDLLRRLEEYPWTSTPERRFATG
jgi:hypothetical protein